MTVKMRNVSGDVIYLDRAGTQRVDVDEVIEVDGDLAPKKDQPDDAAVVGSGDTARAYPHATWAVVTTKSKD